LTIVNHLADSDDLEARERCYLRNCPRVVTHYAGKAGDNSL